MTGTQTLEPQSEMDSIYLGDIIGVLTSGIVVFIMIVGAVLYVCDRKKKQKQRGARSLAYLNNPPSSFEQSAGDSFHRQRMQAGCSRDAKKSQTVPLIPGGPTDTTMVVSVGDEEDDGVELLTLSGPADGPADPIVSYHRPPVVEFD